MNSTKKILVICPDADLSDLYQEILHIYGITLIDTAETVSKSTRFLENNVYDTIIMDCKYPDGELRNLKKIINNTTEILYVTCFLENCDLSTSENVTPITKPFNIDKFYEQITCLTKL